MIMEGVHAMEDALSSLQGLLMSTRLGVVVPLQAECAPDWSWLATSNTQKALLFTEMTNSSRNASDAKQLRCDRAVSSR